MLDMQRAFKTALAMRGRTVTEVAETMGRNRKTLYSAFYGWPNLKTVDAIAKELDIKTSEFIALGE